MRTTVEIDGDLLEELLKVTGAVTKRQAFEIALREYIRARRRVELADLIGDYDDFALTLEELERMRSEP